MKNKIMVFLSLGFLLCIPSAVFAEGDSIEVLNSKCTVTVTCLYVSTLQYGPHGSLEINQSPDCTQDSLKNEGILALEKEGARTVTISKLESHDSMRGRWGTASFHDMEVTIFKTSEESNLCKNTFRIEVFKK
ncbi:MAG: hypothetical protein A3B70_01050 [Deltaproteobacteria bacterium RIFCSPHIGHO2_02_FULL_40_11]|nr:MAG: hypothetical protein A3B70_01050 [Deltaproteobacteria bacterium RIFCSPHIGHO2_02_FULL_40_11]